MALLDTTAKDNAMLSRDLVKIATDLKMPPLRHCSNNFKLETSVKRCV